MNKRDKSFLALSLGIAISSQNLMIIANADSIESKSDRDVTILSDDDFEIKVDTNSQDENLKESSEYQPNPEESKTYNTEGSNSIAFMSNISAASLEATSLSNSNSIGSGKVTLSTLNIRSGPSTSNGIVATLKINETVEILGKSSDWYKVDFNGKQGYVQAAYLKLNPIEKGIDVSKWNGNIDWKNVKNAGIDYVIIRAGYGTSTIDPKFKTYIEGAKSAGLKIGVYWFSYATTPEIAAIEAETCLNALSPYKSSITYPVFFDFEYDSVRYANNNGVKVTKDLATAMANSFLNKVESKGYTSGIYTNRDFSSTYFTDDLINSNNLWVAQYGSTNTFGKPYSMWQYSEKGSVAGISGYVDLNYTCLKTFGGSSGNEDPSTPSGEQGVTTANVNFRKSSSTSSSIIATIPKNTAIEIVDKSNSNWYKVKYKNNTGYVSKDYVKLNNSDSGSDDNNTSTPSSEKGATTANVNFRKSSSTSSSIIATIPKNTTIEIVDKSNSSWYKVKYKNNTGYVSKYYVKLNSSGSDDNNTSTPSLEKGVSTANVNFRKSSSTSSSIIATIPKNTTVEIVDKSNSKWYKVKYKNNTGYVSKAYIKLNNSSSDNETPSTPSGEQGVTSANVNFRKSSSTSSSIITTIPKNTTIEIIDKSNSKWCKVKYKGSTGYVSKDYVKLNNSNSNTSSSNKGVTSANLNLRKSSSTSSSIITTIHKNTTIEVTDKLSSGWYKVKYKSYTGYVSGSYVKI
ncbi:SH3 domain-containing protein [Terrisporobacter vanillatitrophus]|uniref:SH3 domain-containing protein n=1 Tax=Terrisporobacter vanillatitrophus TaxID=3058402 RepID=UPI003367C951